MTDATKMAIEALGGLIESVTGVDQVSAVNQARTALAALRAQPDHSELVKNAARYLWLREQHWSDSKFAVVSNPKTAVNLGSICPSRELLDEAIDEAMAAIGEAT